MRNKLAHLGAFNLLCGELLGEGTYRKTFACRLDPTLVVKVEKEEEQRTFSNVYEERNWRDLQEFKPVARWLAPVVDISPCGMLLLMKRVVPLRANELPDRLPRFLTDLKPENYGLYEGRLVVCDYPVILCNVSLKTRRVDWRVS